MRTILLTEDEFLVRAVVVDAFTEAGFNCLEAATGAAVIDVPASQQPSDANVVDIGLPDLSGDDVIAAADRLRPGIPIIRCSGDHRPATIASKSVHVFGKPYLPGELCRLVETLVEPRPST